jgi:hypothetical protein
MAKTNSTLIMPRKEWENRPFLTPFQYNVNKDGITGGQIITPEVLGNIFKNFCVGK